MKGLGLQPAGWPRAALLSPLVQESQARSLFEVETAVMTGFLGNWTAAPESVKDRYRRIAADRRRQWEDVL